jgi:hypothetical protein
VIWVVLLYFSLACVNCVVAGEDILLDLDVGCVGVDGWSTVWDPYVLEQEATNVPSLSGLSSVS